MLRTTPGSDKNFTEPFQVLIKQRKSQSNFFFLSRVSPLMVMRLSTRCALAWSLFLAPYSTWGSAYYESNEYAIGALGAGPYQSFYSANFTPAEWNFVVPVNRSMSLSSGYLFTAPRGTDAHQAGAAIYDQQGELVWDASFIGQTLTFQVETYLGAPHIIVWQGDVLDSGVGSGYQLLFNQNYELVATVTTNLDGDTGSTYCDFHEGRITSNNTALLTAYQYKSMDLSAYEGPSDGWIMDSVLQEVNITSGEALFTWKASEHVDPGDCYTSVGSGGTSTDNAWDYFHINSIDKTEDGNYLISSRHCYTVYYLDGTNGDIIWRLGGRNSSFTMGNGTQFSWQHHARWVERNETAATMTLFDNAGEYGVQDEASARGLYLSLNFTNMTVELIQDFIPWNFTISESQGSVQLQPNGNFLVGWGYMPWYSEYTSSGELLWTVQYGIGENEAYRMLRFNWTGYPTASPDVSIVSSSSSDILSFYTSWNGDTRTQRWELVGASDSSGSGVVSLYNKTKSGFETAITLNTGAYAYDYYAVRAIGSSGEVLGTSEYSSGADKLVVLYRYVLAAVGLVCFLQSV